jgi:hypothetical protein
MAVRSSWGVVCVAALAACSAGDNTVDPGELELRDLLGVSPEAASAWDGAQRSAARRVLAAGLRDDGGPPAQRTLGDAPGELDARVAELLAGDDAARAADGAGPLGVVTVALEARARAAVMPKRGPLAAAALGDRSLPDSAGPGAELWLTGSWDTTGRAGVLPGRGAALLAALAADAGHPGGPLVVVPAPELAVIAAYVRPEAAVPPRLAVNPVALAALEPAAGEAVAAAAMVRGPAAPVIVVSPPGRPPAAAEATPVASAGGNPYSFYGSVAECALAQRTRCEACLPAGTCRPVTNITDGNAECTMLAADDGRGYFLLCINLALAITSIDRCTGDAAPGCVRDPSAADSLATLASNADFLADPTCGGALDGCLAKIFGPPDQPFPGIDGGTSPAAPPRSTSVSCSNSCNNNPNIACTASPSCDCSGPSCNNSLSCGGACSRSNDQSGCGGTCSTCSSSGGGCSSGSGGGDGCSSGSGGGDSCSSGSGGSCSSGGCSSGSGSGGGGSCSSGSGGGGGCSGGSGGCSGGGCSGSGSSCGGGGGGKCSVATIDPVPGVGLAMSVLWGCLPVALAALTRRRARRGHAADREATDRLLAPDLACASGPAAPASEPAGAEPTHAPGASGGDAP